MNYLEAYYNSYNEEGRLLSRHGQVEYRTTMKYIEESLAGISDPSILEIGAGTGRYSVTLAKQGRRVTALELIAHNLEILRSKLDGTESICAMQGNALDLSALADATFDMTLMMGPMYHLFTEADKIQALSEAVRVTKPGGILLVAYCISDASIIEYGFKAGNIPMLVEKGLLDTETFVARSDPSELFELVRKPDIDRLITGFPVERLHYVATDGLSYFMRRDMEEMDQATFDLFLKYHMTICENPDLVGATAHSLDIMRKR